MSWSSVTAFLAAARSGSNAQAALVLAAIKSELDAEGRLVIDAQDHPSSQRLQWLRERSARGWTANELAHVEAMTFIAIRRYLQSQGLFSSDLRASASPR